MSDQWKPPEPLRLGKSKNTGIGGKQARKPQGLRQVSKKQAKRTEALRDKLSVLLATQHEIYGTERCEMGFALGEKCPVDAPFVVDHVGTRNQADADRYENLQVLCFYHNGVKGSKRVDYRPHRMKVALMELEKEKGEA